LEARWISREHADAALLRRVGSFDGAELVGQAGKEGHEWKGGPDFGGIAIPYIWPGENHVILYRIRRDHPDLEADHLGTMRQGRKYIGPPGRGNALYFPPTMEARWLDDAGMPLVIVEGEFKALALWRLAWHGLGDAADAPAFVPIGLQGVYSWRGKIGRIEDERPGTWRNVKGAIADLGRVEWPGRHVVLLYDTNVKANEGVAQARRGLTRELESRGAEISWFDWPSDIPETVNGIDDFLAQRGPEETIRQLGKARRKTRKRKVATVAEAVRGEAWEGMLIRGDNNGIKPMLANAITFLTHLEELAGMVSHDEFAVRTMALQGTPWDGQAREWCEVDDIRLAEYLQHQGCHVGKTNAAEAVAAVAQNAKFHPVREYLAKLQWDGVERLDPWLTRYLGVADSRYSRAVGSRWLISAVARVMQPGCQADHCLVLVGPQGRKKSTALRVLAGDEWFTDRVGDLQEKDSLQNIHGKWIVEFAELQDVVGRRAEEGAVKAFITCRFDRFRPPYERRPQDFARQCVFAGSVNLDEFLKDETGGRRFWPVSCGAIDIAALQRDRDQLWAEARAKYEARAAWYLDDPELVKLAEEEQEGRYEADGWDDLVWMWVSTDRDGFVAGGFNPPEAYRITSERILAGSIKKPEVAWTQADVRRIGRILRRHGLEYVQERVVDSEGKAVLGPNGNQVRNRFWRWPAVGVMP
jgi:predicted P-loop ATPase